MSVQEARMYGTCKLLPQKNSYQEWTSSSSESPDTLWIVEKPAAGKISSSRVCHQLAERKRCELQLFLL